MTSTAYVSTGATDATGLFTVNNVPAGLYTVYQGPTSGGAWTATGDAAYEVAPTNLGHFNVRDYGALGTGVDDAAAIQAAMDACGVAGGGIVFFPPGTYRVSTSLLIRYSNLRLQGALGYSNTDSPIQATYIYCNQGTAFPIFDAPSGDYKGITIEQICMTGGSYDAAHATTGNKGIHALNAKGWVLRDLFIDQFGDHGVHLEAGVDGIYERLFVQNCLMVRTGRSSLVGAVDIAVTDAVWSAVEATTSAVPGDGTGNMCAIVNRGTNSFMYGCIGQISQIGIAIPSAPSLIHLIGCRADINNGPGFQINGGNTVVTSCWAYRNSQSTDNTSPGFEVTSNCTRSIFAHNYISGINESNQQSYGFTDANSNGGGAISGNQYSGNRVGDYVRGALYHFTGTAPAGSTGLSGQDFQIGAGGLGGRLSVIAGATATGCVISQGSGVPTSPAGVNPTAGDIYFRTDTPSSANQRIYVCTTGGGSPVWSGIA